MYGLFRPFKNLIGPVKTLIPILQKRKLRLREMKWSIPTHAAGRMQRQVQPSLTPLFCTVGLTAF